ncbi:MAG: metallophosphoesterase [Deltaproteobacteria bacterium]|nr:metallophosphoesterase [Deltaproteobacteria bacterium]
MSRIAHLTDLHVLEDHHRLRDPLARFRLAFLSARRPLDAAGRRTRVRRALDRAARAAPDHLVITGDLTEDGTAEQFEVLAELLLASRFEPSQITLLPGNHDTYSDPDAWEKALSGPLRPFAATSRAGAVSVLADAVIVQLSTPIHQHYARSAGLVRQEAVRDIDRIAGDPSFAGRTLIVAQHHPPLRHPLRIVHFWDGLLRCDLMTTLLLRHEHAHVLHGHIHESRSRRLAGRSASQVFSAPAVVDHPDPLRLYEAVDGRLLPLAAPVPHRAALPAAGAPVPAY